MHILLVSDGATTYGAAKSMYQMASELLKLKAGVKVSVVLQKKSNQQYGYDLKALGCNVYRIEYRPFCRRKISQNKKWKYLFQYIVRGLRYTYGRLTGVWQLERQLEISTVDIVHSNNLRDDLGALIAKKYRKPLLWHIRGFGDLDFSDYSYRINYIGFMNQTASQMLAVSDAVREHWIKKGIQQGKIKTLYNGLDADVPVKESCCRDNSQPVRFLIMGSVSATKGQWQIVEAVSRMDNFQRANLSVDIAGSGNQQYVEELLAKIHSYGLDGCIHLLGYHHNMHQNAYTYDCGLMCSRSEGFGRVTAEYMMAGLPVIASNSGANPELIQDGENGLLYCWADVEDLKGKMLWMCSHPVERFKMGMTARHYAQEHFSARKNAELVYQEYRTLLGE